MSTIYYNSEVNDIELKITDKYIQYGNELLPTSALSFISINKYEVRWWIPILLLVVAVIGFIYSKTNYETGSFYFLSMLLLIIGLIVLWIDIIISRKRIIRIYSHSKEHLYIEWKKGNYQPVVDALYKVIEDEKKPNVEDSTKYMP